MSRDISLATNSKLYLDNAELDPNLLTKRQYFRGMVSGRPNSFAFLSLQPNGEFDIHYRTAGTVTSGHFDAGGLTTNSALEQLLMTSGSEPFDEVFTPPQLELTDERPVTAASQIIPVEPSTGGIKVTGGYGFSSVYSIEVPPGQSLVGVMSRGPGRAITMIAKDVSHPYDIWDAVIGVCRSGITGERLCVVENPDPGTYYFVAHKFDSTEVEISAGYADELAPYEGFTAPIAIDMDADLYQSFSSASDAIDYLAALFAFSNTIYEREVRTTLKIGDVVFQSSDVASQLYDIDNRWNTSYPDAERALVAHVTLGYSGGMAWRSEVSLCSKEYGYSVSGVDGISPELITNCLGRNGIP